MPQLTGVNMDTVSWLQALLTQAGHSILYNLRHVMHASVAEPPHLGRSDSGHPHFGAEGGGGIYSEFQLNCMFKRSFILSS